MPSLNHSYICIEIIKQLLENKEVQPLPELTLDVDKGLTFYTDGERYIIDHSPNVLGLEEEKTDG